MLLKELASYIRDRRDNPAVHIVNRTETVEDQESGPVSSAEPKLLPGRLVEGDLLATTPIRPSGRSCLTHFLDGIERTHVPCYWSAAPVLYGYVGAVIRCRGEDRRMRTWRKDFRESLFVPFGRIDPTGMTGHGLSVTNTYYDGEMVDEHPAAMLDRAHKAVNRLRSSLESRLARDWIGAHTPMQDAWLMIDGSLTGIVDSDAQTNVIGVIKSHQTQYFALDDQQKILNMAAGERSSVFAVQGRGGMDVYSWYLRLHSNVGRGLYFGLIRIEAPPAPAVAEMADQISAWLLAERAPLSLPDSRWDRLMYPIRDCEQYLRSTAPTRTMLESAFCGL